jgi:hypothetical protein
MFISRSEDWHLENSNPLQLVIVEGFWGQVKIEDVRCLLENVAKQILQYFNESFSARIVVECHPHRSAAQVQCRNALIGEHIVLLSHQDFCSWSYEFAHELCHILSGYHNLQSLPNQWFHETLGELASMFTLKQMAVGWRKSPPKPDWQLFSTTFYEYSEKLVSSSNFQLPSNTILPDWFKANEQRLRSDPYQRGKNGIVALHLLPLIESNPQYWQSVCFIPDSMESFEKFLGEWRKNCPEQQQPFVTQIAELFNFSW